MARETARNMLGTFIGILLRNGKKTGESQVEIRGLIQLFQVVFEGFPDEP